MQCAYSLVTHLVSLTQIDNDDIMRDLFAWVGHDVDAKERALDLKVADKEREQTAKDKIRKEKAQKRVPTAHTRARAHTHTHTRTH